MDTPSSRRCSFNTATPSLYTAALDSEAPKLVRQLDLMDDDERYEFEKKFNSAFGKIEPKTRNMVIGGLAGGTFAGGAAAAALSVRQIGQIISHPIAFGVAVTVMGVIGGALAPKVLNYFSNPAVQTLPEAPGRPVDEFMGALPESDIRARANLPDRPREVPEIGRHHQEGERRQEHQGPDR